MRITFHWSPILIVALVLLAGLVAAVASRFRKGGE